MFILIYCYAKNVNNKIKEAEMKERSKKETLQNVTQTIVKIEILYFIRLVWSGCSRPRLDCACSELTL